MEIRIHAVQNRKIYLAEINGADIKTEKDYVRAMADTFALPHKLPLRSSRVMIPLVRSTAGGKRWNIIIA